MILDAGGRNTPTLLNAETTLRPPAQAQLSYEVQSPIVVDMEPLPPGVSRQRGVSLSDNGPVPLPDGGGVRRVARGQRNSTQRLVQNRYSRGSWYDLPPGAAPPQPPFGTSGQ